MAFAYHERLKGAVAELRERQLLAVESGLPDPAYHQAIGYFKALREVLDEAEAIRKRMME